MRVRKHLVVTTAAMFAIAAVSACSSSSSSKSSQPAGSTTSAATAPAGPAAALTCATFAGTLKVSPPVSPTVSVAHTLTAKGTLSGCTGTPGITSGELGFVAKRTAKLNCAEIATFKEPGTASVSVKWNNGQTSTGPNLAVTYDSVVSSTISGKFTGGTAFVGKTSTSTTVNSPDNGGCFTEGVSLSTATLSLAQGTTYTIS
jgi:hypothetical protein